MKPLHLSVGCRCVLLTIAALLAALSVNAATLTWDANGLTAGQTNGAGAWLGSNQWWNGSANQNWSSGSDATFGGLSTTGGAVTLGSPTTVNTIIFNQFTGTYTLGTAAQSITINGGVIKNAGSSDVSIISPLVLGGAQTWTNDSTSAINVRTATTLNGLLTVGGTGSTIFFDNANAVISGTGGISKTGTGNITIYSTNTYSGGTRVASGTFSINAVGALGSTSSPLTVDGGTLNMQGNSLVVGNLTGTGGVISGTSGTRTLTIGQGNGTGGNFQGVIEDGAGGTTAIIKTGSGNISLSGTNTYSGGTRVASGTFSINAVGALGSTSSPLTVDGGTLNMQGNSLVVGNLTGTGGVISGTSGTRTLTIGQGNGTGGNFQGVIEDGAGGTTAIIKTGSGNISLSGTNTYSGGTTISGGTLSLGGNNTLGNTAVSIGAAALAAATGISDAVGTLDPTAAANIHIGAGATLAFAKSTSIDWTGGTLNITGSFVPGNLGSLRFGNNFSQPGLVPSQLNKITAVGYTGFGLDANGYLTATVANFSAWAEANAPGQTINQDHDQDGVSNGVEYFMGLSGNVFTAIPVPNASHVISWPKGASYTGIYGTHYSIQISSDLGVGDPWTDVTLPNVTIGGSVNYDLDTAPSGPRKFARLKVTGP